MSWMASRCERRAWPSPALTLSVLLNLCLIVAVSYHSMQGTTSSRTQESWGSIAPVRALASSSDAQEGHAEGEHHESHDYIAMIFLVNGLVVGTAVLHVSSVFTRLQMTIVLFLLGVIASFFWEGLNLKQHTSVMGESYSMWMGIDPHTLLYTLLPALLAGDAMTIDTSVAKRVGLQCLYLAGPGVLVQAFAVAGFLTWMLKWDFLLSMTTGSILCATDPVAVVALLKELGASPVLTVRIQGESLLNDGTAIVLFMVSYEMLSGKSYDYLKVIQFIVEVALMAWAMGMFSGYIFFSWIRAASNKLSHSSSIIQIMLTICCAYWSFVTAEGIFGLSGVLATVASSLILAHHMWPYIVCKQSMHHVWHIIETLGNIIIFFLAGALSGRVVFNIHAIDFVYLLVIYIVLLFVRGALIFASRPLLRQLSTDKHSIPAAEAAVMTWGGLRGAVGLAMAMQVYNGLADNHISEEDGRRVLFFVAGIAFLTTVINASTAPRLVSWLGVTALPSAQQKVMKMLVTQLMSWSISQKHPPEVAHSLDAMLKDLTGSIDASGATGEKQAEHDFEENDALTERWQSCCAKHQAIIQDGFTMLRELPEGDILGAEFATDAVSLIGDDNHFDTDVARALTKTFFALVQGKYWNFIEEGELRPGSAEADALFSSLRFASSPPKVDLTDWPLVEHFVESSLDSRDVQTSPSNRCSERSNLGENSFRSRCRKLVASSPFGMSVAFFILATVVCVVLQETVKQIDSGHVAWFVLEIIFNVFFTLEFSLKFVAYRLEYFKDPHNIFDFTLVILGLAGCGFSISIHAQGDGASGNDQTEIIRLMRVFRVLRFLRVFRLFHATLSVEDPFASKEVVASMRRISTLTNFIRAHLQSEKDMLKYLAGNDKIDDNEAERELARVILQSQCAVYNAMQQLAQVEESMDHTLLTGVAQAKHRRSIVEALEKFIMDAWKDDALSSTEAEALLHPIHNQIKGSLKEISNLTAGRKHTSSCSDLGSASGQCGRSLDGHEEGETGQPLSSPIDKELAPGDTGRPHDIIWDAAMGS